MLSFRTSVIQGREHVRTRSSALPNAGKHVTSAAEQC